MQIEQASRQERMREKPKERQIEGENNVAHLIKINVIKIKANKRQRRRRCLVCDSKRGLLNEDITLSRGVEGKGRWGSARGQ